MAEAQLAINRPPRPLELLAMSDIALDFDSGRTSGLRVCSKPGDNWQYHVGPSKEGEHLGFFYPAAISDPRFALSRIHTSHDFKGAVEIYIECKPSGSYSGGLLTIVLHAERSTMDKLPPGMSVEEVTRDEYRLAQRYKH
ncbi:hypothetical protein HY638_04260 [Candidatus Woesearchaeota archaeon]|nr:hypothetical protein [Candidatus Woesearchaeota archaeon]